MIRANYTRSAHALLMCVAIVILCGNMGLCNKPRGDCYGFGGKDVSVLIVEPYNESTDYQNEKYPWPVGELRGIALSSSCVVADMQDYMVMSMRHESVFDHECSTHAGVLDDWIVSIEYAGEIKIGHDDYMSLPVEIQSAFNLDAYATGRAEIYDGCVGRYSVFLYKGLAISTGMLFDEPEPGMPPNWLVTRVFEPESGCEGLELAPDTTWCADSWVAQILSIGG